MFMWSRKQEGTRCRLLSLFDGAYFVLIFDQMLIFSSCALYRDFFLQKCDHNINIESADDNDHKLSVFNALCNSPWGFQDIYLCFTFSNGTCLPFIEMLIHNVFQSVRIVINVFFLVEQKYCEGINHFFPLFQCWFSLGKFSAKDPRWVNCARNCHQWRRCFCSVQTYKTSNARRGEAIDLVVIMFLRFDVLHYPF